MKLKKFISTVMALALIGTTIIVPSASAATIQLGNSNQANGITAMDAYWIYMYLNGSVTATPQQLTAMDVNQDGVIDTSDATTIMYNIANVKSFGTTNRLYNVPDNSTKTYRKHDCNAESLTQYSTYTINATNDKPTRYSTYAEFTSPDILDKENIGCIKLTYTKNNNEINLGSGFVVDDHVIATAAHCVYNLDTKEFLPKIKVKVYNDNCSRILDTADARYIHIPDNYAESTTNTPKNVNHDYALIYVEEDLSPYKVDVGVMTDYFMTTGKYLTTSGFTAYNDGTQRYFSEGSVTTMDSFPEEKPYRYHSNGICKGGKSGGMTYFKSKFPYNADSNESNPVNREAKSVVGINTHSSGQDTYGCRVTTTLLRFFFQNNYLC